MPARISIDNAAIASFCVRNRIQRLSLFGSVLRDDFHPDSDVDVVIEFEPDALVGLMGLVGMETELSELLGRKVDLNTAAGLHRRYRERVLADAEVLYAA